jgi:hypothetical protein
LERIRTVSSGYRSECAVFERVLSATFGVVRRK